MSVEIQELKESNYIFEEKMKSAHTVETLKLWYQSAEKVSVSFMDVARSLSSHEDKHEVLYNQLHEASHQLVTQCNKIYDEKIKALPEFAKVARNTLWSGGRLGIVAFGIVSLFMPFAPGISFVAGAMSLVYAASEFFSKTKKLDQDIHAEKSTLVKVESGVRFLNASAEITFGVMGIVLLAGVAPYLAIPVVAGTLGVVGVDVFFKGKDFLEKKEEINQAEKEEKQQLIFLEQVINRFKTIGIEPHVLAQSFVKHMGIPVLFQPTHEQSKHKKNDKVSEPLLSPQKEISEPDIQINTVRMS